MRRTIAVLLLALLLTGCAAPSGEAPALSAAGAASEPAARAENMSSSLVESSARPMPETEVLAAYERAQKVYGWFDLAPPPTTGEPTTVNGVDYYRVDMEGMADLEDLRACLRGVFTQELTDRLLDSRTVRIQYRDVNGALCVAGDSRVPDAGKGQAQVEVEQLEETLYFVNVTVDLLGEDRETVVGLESWSFPYAFVEDRWVFTEFRLVS